MMKDVKILHVIVCLRTGQIVRTCADTQVNLGTDSPLDVISLSQVPVDLL